MKKSLLSALVCLILGVTMALATETAPRLSAPLSSAASRGGTDTGFDLIFYNDIYSWTQTATGSNLTYTCYIPIPAEVATALAGNKLTEITFCAAIQSAAAGLNGSAFVSENLDADPVTSTSAKITNGYNNGNARLQTIVLQEPYEIKENTPFYFGYTVEKCKSNDYPVGLSMSDANTYSGYANVKSAMGANRGTVNIGNATGCNMVLSAKTVGDTHEVLDFFNVGTPSIGNFTQPIMNINTSANVSMPVFNFGSNPITSIEYTTSINGGAGVSSTLQVDVPANTFITVALPIAEAQPGPNEFAFSLTSINGIETQAKTNGSFIGITEGFERKFVVEEGTGTWCGYCPRGIVGMDKMSARYPEKFIPIAVHSGDAMAVSSYAPLIERYFEGFPSAVINRDPNFVIDPSLEDLEYSYNYWLSQETFANISLTATKLDETGTQLKLKANTTYSIDVADARYAIAFVVLEDGLQASQTNYYANNQLGYLEGWSNKGSSVAWTYLDTARDIQTCWGIDDSVPQAIEKGVEYEFEYEIALTSVKDIEKSSIVALLLDKKSGIILNAAKITAADYEEAKVYQSVDPEEGTMLLSLKTVTLTFAEGSVADYGSKYQNVTITDGNEYSALCSLQYGEKENQIIVNFSEITANGQYTINFPEDAITIDGVALPAFTLEYEVGQSIENASTLIPAPGDVKWLYEMVYSNGAVDKDLSTDYNGSKATIVTPLGAVEELNAVYDWQIGAGKYRFALRRLATEVGEYTVHIPGDLLYYNNENWEKVFMPECTFKYNVTGAELTSFEANPSVENPTTLFNQFAITFPGYETVEIASNGSVSIWYEDREYAVTSFYLDQLTVEGNTIKYKNDYNSYIDPGLYYMTFPEGCVLLGEEKTPCTPFLYELKVVEPEPVNMVFTPADGASVNMLYHVEISFPDIKYVEVSNSPYIQLLKVLEDGTTATVGGTYTAYGIKRVNDNTFDAEFNNMAIESGEYQITVKKNSFNFDGGFNQDVAITVNFTAPATVTPTIDPSDGSALDKIQNFSISFPDEAYVEVNPYLSNKSVDLYSGTELIDNGWGGYTNQKIGSASLYTPVEGSTNAFTFSLSAAALDKGDYLLVIPEGLFLIGEDKHTYSSAAKYTYQATGEGLDKIVVTPGTEVSALKDMTITYVNESEIYLQNEWVGFSFYKEIEGQAWGTYLEFPSASNGGVSVEGNELKITLGNEYTEDGRYYIDITSYSLFMSDKTTVSTPQRVYWTVDSNVGIEDVKVDNRHDGRIYTITGIEVKEMNTPGIYICNGKKVIVR